MTASVAIIHQPTLLQEDDITHDVIRGLASEQVDVTTYSVTYAQAHLDELDECDGMVFGSFIGDGSRSGELDAFFQATNDRYRSGIWRDKIATAFTHSLELCAGSMPLMLQLSLFCARHNMIWIDESHKSQLTINGISNQVTSASDIPAPGFTFGQRVAQITKHWLAD